MKDLKAAKWRLASSLAVQAQMDSCALESELHALERVPAEGRAKPTQFIPIRFVFTNKLSKETNCCWPSMPSRSRNRWDVKSVSAETQGILLLGALQRASNEYDNILAARAAQSPYGEIALGIGLALLPELAVCGRAFKALMGRRQAPSVKSLAKELIESDDMLNTLATYFENVNQKAVNSTAKARLGRFADSLDKVSKDTIEAVRNPLVANANIDSETTKRFEAWSAKNQIMTSIVTGLQRSLIGATSMELILHSFIFWYEGADLLKLVHQGFKLTAFGDDLAYSATVYDVFSDLILYDMLRAYVKSYFTVGGDLPIDQMPSRWPESNTKGLDEAQRTLIYNRFRKVPWKDGSRPPVNSYKDLIKHWKDGRLEPLPEIRDYPIQ